MLVAALGLTILGFAFLVAAVATGQIAWAWACIGVGAVGLALLLLDLVRGRTGGDRPTDEESLEAGEGSHQTGEDSHEAGGETDEADIRTDG